VAQTTNLNLTKPTVGDQFNVQTWNHNLDLIDGFAGTVPLKDHKSLLPTYGVATSTLYGHAMASGATPLSAGAAAVGLDNGKFAREGHVHPAPKLFAQTSGTNNYVAALSVTLTEGTPFTIQFMTANTANAPTLNVSGTGAKTVVQANGASIAAGGLVADAYYHMVLIGSTYRILADVGFASQKGQPNGLATLDANNKVPVTQLPIGMANGVASLDASAKIPAVQIPSLGYAPISHASTAATYGVGSASDYGHVKVSAGNGLNIANGTVAMARASTNAPGAVQLTNDTNSSATDLAPTAAALKQVKDSIASSGGGSSNSAPIYHASAGTSYGVATSTLYGHAMASGATPLPAGAAAVGLDNGKFAREGHVHPAQTSVTGNAGTATRLASPRSISLTGIVAGSANFDGSAAVSIATSLNMTNSNIAFGNDVLSAPGGGGSYNVALGVSTLRSVSYGTHNIGIGLEAGSGASGASYNVFIGHQAGSHQIDQGTLWTSGSGCVFLGRNTRGVNGASNQIVIGQEASGNGANTVTLGNSNITKLHCQATSITALSDQRIKEDIEPADLDMCLADVKRLPVHRYKYKDFTGTHLDNHVTGWLAEDVETVFPKAVDTTDRYFPVLGVDGKPEQETVMDPDGNTRQIDKMFLMNDVKDITMTEALPTLWAAVQRLAAIVDEQAQRIITLEGGNTA
jgi:hypothetical protein